MCRENANAWPLDCRMGTALAKPIMLHGESVMGFASLYPSYKCRTASLRTRLAAAQRQRLGGMQLVPIIAIRIGAVESISGPVATVAVKRVLAEAAGMTAEAEMFAAEPGAATKTSLMAHAAEMRAAAKSRMAAAEAATAKAAAVAATTTTAAACVGRADGERRGERCCCQNHDGSFHGKLLSLNCPAIPEARFRIVCARLLMAGPVMLER
jgi:hypothetical protein